ncbi:class I SAM-dependent methyltransferase [Lactovum odontotermitis]
MNEKLQNFYNQQNTPWMKLFYRLIYTQLPETFGKKVLDFGAGFGWTANYLAGLGNEVVAVEPNPEMVKPHLAEHPYLMQQGDVHCLKDFPDGSFDLIVCHNVMEYVENADERAEIMAEFMRLLLPAGAISIIKHNFNGAIMQRAVFENETEEALELLSGTVRHSGSFGPIHHYDLSELVDPLPLKLDKLFGVRTFFGIQPNEFKTAPGWADKMYKLEMEVAENPEFNSVSFFHHAILTKE